MLENPKDRVMRAKDGLQSADYGIRKLTTEYIRYLGVAVFNAIFFWTLYEAIYWMDTWTKYPATVAWAVGYIIGSFEAHFMHRLLTFKSNVDYKESLYWAFIVYGVIGIVSTISEHILVYVFDVHHRIAWAINMCAFGFMMFLGLRLLAFPPEMDVEDSSDPVV
ncbi:MAG: GtrA family protein [Candidatus Thalassarchaeaceae archaeon]|nr:GtrA family protein [Candidatus Thalassarchaeaceae archaeon]